MKLFSIQLQNFQAHRQLEIEFSPTITSIVGKTDGGKSAVLRALRWTCLNDIAGDEFISEGQSETRIVLRVRTNGGTQEIRRIRGSRINSYELDDVEFKAFGTSVPPDISNLLHLSEINFQGQHDGPFWFSESAPEVSRRLNAIVDLSVIDTTLENIASEVRQALERKRFTEERLSGAKWDLEKLEPQRARIGEFKSLKEAHERSSKVKEDCDRLDGAIKKLCANRDDAKSLEERSTEGGSLLACAKEALDCSRKEGELSQLLSNISRCQEEAEPPPNFTVVERAFEEWQEQNENTNRLVKLVESVRVSTSRVTSANEKLDEAEEQFHKETKGRQCPTCNQIIQ